MSTVGRALQQARTALARISGWAEEKGHIQRYLVVAQALASLGDALDAIERLVEDLIKQLRDATTDSKTGLLTGRQAQKHLAMAVEAALSNRDVAALVLGGGLSLEAVMKAMADPKIAVRGAVADVRGLGHANDRGGHATGDQLLRTCANAIVNTVDKWHERMKLRRRRKWFADPMGQSAVYRDGRGDEMLVMLHGMAGRDSKALLKETVAALEERRVPGLDIAPALSIGSMSLWAAIWHLGEFYRWVGLDQPTGRDLTTRVREMWKLFMDVRAERIKFTGYVMLFADALRKGEDHFGAKLSTKLSRSGFRGMNPDEIHAICKRVLSAKKPTVVQGIIGAEALNRAQSDMVESWGARVEKSAVDQQEVVMYARYATLDLQVLKALMTVYVLSMEYDIPVTLDIE